MKQRTSFRCIYYGIATLIVGLIVVGNLDDNHIESFCYDKDQAKMNKCITFGHDNFYYLFLQGLGFGEIAVVIGDLFTFAPWEKNNEVEDPLRTFCNNCGKSLTKGTLWCGTPTCKEVYREKEISTKC